MKIMKYREGSTVILSHNEFDILERILKDVRAFIASPGLNFVRDFCKESIESEMSYTGMQPMKQVYKITFNDLAEFTRENPLVDVILQDKEGYKHEFVRFNSNNVTVVLRCLKNTDIFAYEQHEIEDWTILK